MSRDADRTPTLQITSLSNPRVKWVQSLRKRRVRESEGVSIVEGFEEIRLAMDAGMMPQILFYCPPLVGDDSRLSILAELAGHGVGAVSVGRAVFAKLSYRESPDGWLAVVPARQHPLSDLSVGSTPLVLVCESIEKPGNLGAMLRTAEAAGVDAVIATSPVADWGNPNVIRASKGAVFAVPVATADSEQVARWLTDRRIEVIVATPDSDTLVTDLDLTGSVAVVVGAEHAGVSADWLRRADRVARLPMLGRLNSLNVATSAAIVIYEALRQRRLGPPPERAPGQPPKWGSGNRQRG